MTCKPIKIVTGIEVIADMSGGLSKWNRSRNSQQLETELKQLCKDFNHFIKDHRSMDWVRLETRQRTETVCSSCNNQWEYDTDIRGCAWCGEVVEQIGVWK